MTYWILQASPEVYDARAALGDDGALDRWRIARYRDEITPGDEFALWISGRESGVYAFGIVTGPVVRDSDPDPRWRDPADGAALDWRAGIKITERLELPILRGDLRADPGFAGAAILKMPGGGNPFPVTAAQWQVLQSHRASGASGRPGSPYHLKSTGDLLRIVRDGQSAADLRAYFGTAAPDGPPLYTGSRFDTLDGGGSRPGTRDKITAADLVAVQCLSVVVPATVSLDLLEGHLGIEVSDLLRHIPAGIDLGEPGARDHVLPGSPADRAWHLLTGQDGVGWVIAGKLLARKRPRLIPVWDHVVKCATGCPGNAWLWLDELLGHNLDLTLELRQLHHQAHLSDLVSRLRVLDVVLWMRHNLVHVPADCPGMD